MGKARTDIGPVSIISCGEYSSTAKYEKLSVVSFEGSSYIAKVANEGVPVTNTEVWHLIAERGKSTYEVAVENGYEGTEEDWTNEHLSPEGYYNKNTIDNKFNNESNSRVNADAILQSQINGLASGSPLVASSVSDMTDTSHVYVNTTDGHWYWHDGITWNDGGAYQSTSNQEQVSDNTDNINAITETYPNELKQIVESDLDTVSGTCDNSGVIDYTVIARRITDYLDLEQLNYVGLSEDYAETRYYWIRVFDENKDFLGNANRGAYTAEKTYSSSILSVFPTAKYIILCIRSIPITDMSAMEGGVIIGKYKSVKGKLEQIFKKFNNSYSITDLLKLENGGLNTSNGSFEFSTSMTFNKYRSPLYTQVVGGTGVILNNATSQVQILEYNSSFEFIKSTSTSDSIVLDENTRYIKFNSNDGLTKEVSYTIVVNDSINNFIITKDGMKPRYIKNARTSEICEKFFYKLNGKDEYTSGLLKLPPNYTPDGEKVPLIVFCHGSADYISAFSQVMTTHYEDYYNFLRDSGYAIFDCWGWSTKYFDYLSGYNYNCGSTWGAPTNMLSYISGIEFILKNYNIDSENIFVTGKSLGGSQGTAFLYQNKVKIKAVGLLAPSMNPLNSVPAFRERERHVLFHDLDFEGDYENIIDIPDSNFSYSSEAFRDFVRDNKNKMAGYNPYWQNSNLPLSQKVENSLLYKDGLGVDYSNIVRTCDIPLKIWVADDDTNIRVNEIKNFIKTLKNGGCLANIRQMPDGTGGHHSVDTDENAPRIDSITTKLGITYTDVPVAYAELVEYFDENQ